MRQRQRDGETISFKECGCVMLADCKLLAMDILRALAVLVLVCGSNMLLPGDVSAQEINFDQIDRFESLGTGTLRVGEPPKTIIDDGERHVVILTIWNADAETKVYWRSPDGNDARTTIYRERVFRRFKPLVCSSSKRSASQVEKSTSGTCCWG
jgi:hypothetical protein